MPEWLAALARFLDPRGPLGEVLSPSEVYKERLGLPTQSPHSVRAAVTAPKEHIEHALALPRFVAMADAHEVPASRVAQVSAHIEEHWTPVYRRCESTDLVAILLASQDQIGWTVTQRESHQSRLARRTHENREQFEEICQTAQIQATDEFYNMYYDTIKGNDPVILNGEVLRSADGQIIRGGTNITHGRREYREKTKGMVHWDAGFWRERQAAIAEMDSRPVRNVRRAIESYKGELPMHNPVGINFWRDRRSAV